MTGTKKRIKHDWHDWHVVDEPIAVRCSVCKTIAVCEADWCDSAGIVKWINKMKRQECKGKR